MPRLSPVSTVTTLTDARAGDRGQPLLIVGEARGEAVRPLAELVTRRRSPLDYVRAAWMLPSSAASCRRLRWSLVAALDELRRRPASRATTAIDACVSALIRRCSLGGAGSSRGASGRGRSAGEKSSARAVLGAAPGDRTIPGTPRRSITSSITPQLLLQHPR